MSAILVADKLRASLLQAAIQGKLTEQLPEDGDARDLLKAIQIEKERLIKEGSLKKEKPLPAIYTDEIPFDISESWVWVRLGNIISLTSGQDLTTSEYNSNKKGIPYITGASNFNLGIIDINRWTESPKSVAYYNDLLITCKGTVGQIAFLKVDRAHIARQIMAISNPTNYVNLKYIEIFLKYYLEQLKSAAKGVIPGVSRSDILNALIPLPSLAEQNRIVTKLEEALAKIEALKTDETQLYTLQKAFPNKLRASLLQAAIQGKLTEQLAEDGNAQDLLKNIQTEKERLIKEGLLKKEKPLPAITEDEIPFDIPESWVWVRLGCITNYGIGKQVSQSNIPQNSLVIELEDIEKDSFRLLQRITNRTPKSSKNKFSKNDVLYGKLRPYLKKIIIADTSGFCSTEIIPFNGYGLIDVKYLMYCMVSPFIDNTVNNLTYGMDMPRLGTQDAIKLPIPLPPLAEQNRIVAKLEALFNKLDKLSDIAS